MTEKEKMLAGMEYDPSDAELTALRQAAHRLSRAYNNTDETDDKAKQRQAGTHIKHPLLKVDASVLTTTNHVID